MVFSIFVSKESRDEVVKKFEEIRIRWKKLQEPQHDPDSDMSDIDSSNGAPLPGLSAKNASVLRVRTRFLTGVVPITGQCHFLMIKFTCFPA